MESSGHGGMTGDSIPLPESLKGMEPGLAGLLERSFQFIGDRAQGPTHAFEGGVMRELRAVLQAETDPLRRQHITNLLNDLRTYFRSPSVANPEINDGLILIHITPDGFTAAVTLTPPRGLANIPTEVTVRSALERAGIRHGIDMLAVERLLEVLRKDNDLVWQAVIARGEPALPARPTRIEFRVKVIDKAQLRQQVSSMPDRLTPFWEPVDEGTLIGILRPPAPGVAGRDVYDRTIAPAEARHVAFNFGEEIALNPANNTLTAQAAGYVVADGSHLNIVPFYVIDDPAHRALGDLTFAGAVFVRGNLQGPGSVQCEDLFVLGNCEQANITAQGDVFIAGGVIGHRQGTIDADGGVYAGFVSEAGITALGEVVVANAIINSKVISNDAVRVTSEKGMITGGTIQALKEIVVRTIGSEFGMLTETVVGKDFLTTQRLEEIAHKIKLHEDNLRRIAELKNELVRAKVRVEKLPRDKQEIYIGVLRKEQQSLAELRSLNRRKARLSQGLKEFLTACIRVLDGIYPPVRVQVVNDIMEITKKLTAVTLQYDKNVGIVSNFGANPQEDAS